MCLFMSLTCFSPMDQSALKNADVLIMTGLTQTPLCNPDSMLGELCITVCKFILGFMSKVPHYFVFFSLFYVLFIVNIIP